MAHELADKGVFLICKNDKGEELCYIEIFAPGILERMVGNRQQLAEHPEIGRAFDEYTKKTGANLAATLPMGSSLMRVIPIERAIDGNPKALPIEKISHYLDMYDTFSVSDCSCRAARRIQGEGCGHLETDMCLHLGPSAEYYADTGKARYITRQEAEELLRRAEENGLLHSMPNINDPGHSDSICNCCACSCFGLRIGFLFGARDAIRSNFVAEVDEEKCVACGQCVETCPGNALKLGQKLCTKEPLPAAPAYKKITENNWSEADWDQLTKEISLKQIKLDEKDKKLLENWSDFQKEYEKEVHDTYLYNSIILVLVIVVPITIIVIDCRKLSTKPKRRKKQL